MAAGVALMALVTMFLLAGAIPVMHGAQAIVFKTPVFIGLLILLGASSVSCCIRHPFSFRRAGFHLVHAGVVVVLAGAGIGFLAGRDADVTVPVAANHSISRLTLAGGMQMPIEFGISATKFDVESYDPDYHLFRPDGKGPDRIDTDYVFVRTIKADADGVFNLSPTNRVRAAELKAMGKSWVQQHVLPNGWILQRANATPRHFEASVRFTDLTGARRDAVLRVNHPVTHHGWRFYLQSYNDEPSLSIILSARKDPGRRVVIAGIYALMAGSFMLCLSRGQPNGGTRFVAPSDPTHGALTKSQNCAGGTHGVA